MQQPCLQLLLAGAVLDLIAKATYLALLALKTARSAAVTLHLYWIISFPNSAIIINFATDYWITAQEFLLNAKQKEFGIHNE